MLKLIVLALVFAIKSFALVCGQFGTFVEYNGHYYTITKDRLTFTYAKTFVEAADGYLAIPNNQDENEFLASLVLGNQFAWIGIYDSALSNNYCYETGSCSYDSSRFKSIKNSALIYSNWEVNQPDNLLKTSDINQLIEISPLGEHWVALSSVNYKWYDFGNHNDEHNNPAMFLAIYEFDTVPECFNSDDSSELVDLHCNTAVSSTDGLTADSGQLLQCETDENGVSYCPANLAPCQNIQNTTDGYSESHQGITSVCPESYFPSATNSDGLPTQCNTYNMNTTSQSSNYSCPSGNLNSSQCCTTESTAASVTRYSCPYGGTLTSTSSVQCRDECTWWASSGENGGKATHTITGGSACGSTYSDYWGDGRADTYMGSCGTTLWTATAASSTPICQKTCSTTVNCFESCRWWASSGTYGGKSTHTITGGSACGSTYSDYWGDGRADLYQGSCGSSSWQVTSSYNCSYTAQPVYTCTNPDYTLSGSQCIQTTCFPSTETLTCGSGGQNNLTCNGDFPDAWLYSLYVNHLCRCPDQNGYNYWMEKINTIGHQATYDLFHDAATSSGETFSNNGCGELETSDNITCNGTYSNQWLYDVYVNHLCRCPDQNGYNYWLNQLNNGVSQEQVLNAIKISSEENGEPYQTYCGSVENECYAGTIETSNPVTGEYTYYTYHCEDNSNVYGESYVPQNEGGEDYTDSNPPGNNCVQQNYVCPYSAEQICTDEDNTWQCSPHPCVDADDLEHTDTEVGSQDGDDDGWNQQTGACDGQLYLFGGTSAACRSWDLYGVLDGSECCSDNALLFGLIRCSSEEKILAQKRKAGNCHYVGEFCSRKLRLGFARICVQKKKSSCCFNSELARIINEQGRPQLNKGWGTASNPECKGFTPEEFQKLDLSKIDFTEFTENIQLPNMQDLGESIKNRVENNLNVSFPQQ